MPWFGPSRLIAGAAACVWIVAAPPPAPGVQTPATPSSVPATVQSTEPEPLKPTVHS